MLFVSPGRPGGSGGPSMASSGSANFASVRGPTPRTWANSDLVLGNRSATFRRTASGRTMYDGTPISRATLTRHSCNADSTPLWQGRLSAGGAGVSARRMTAPTRAVRDGPTPGTSASAAASAGGRWARRSSTSGSSGQPPHTVFRSTRARWSRASRAEISRS